MDSTTLQKARAYEAQHGAAIPAAERPAYHLTPYVGWMNDPNGFSYYQGKYHLFYQYYPYKTVWGPMHWGHAVSSDLLHWEYLPAALAPDSPSDKDGCFSGSAAQLPDGRQLLLYTSVRREEQPDGKTRDVQTQSVAVGDGLDYVKLAQNPVLDETCLPEGFSRFDFRDPKIWQEADGSYSAVLVGQGKTEGGAALLFHSADGFRWEYVTILDASRGEYGVMWECPDFFELDGKQVLMVGPMEMQARDEFHNGHCVIALIGSYDPVNHRFVRENVQLMDEGIDFEGVRLYRTECDHGSSSLVTMDGYQASGFSEKASGVVFESPSEKSRFYLAGDTIYCQHVVDAVEKFKPGIVAVNAAGAQFPLGHLLIVNQYDVRSLMHRFPELDVIATHVEGVSHATVNRPMLREFAAANHLDRLWIPNDAEEICFE